MWVRPEALFFGLGWVSGRVGTVGPEPAQLGRSRPIYFADSAGLPLLKHKRERHLEEDTEETERAI